MIQFIAELAVLHQDDWMKGMNSFYFLYRPGAIHLILQIVFGAKKKEGQSKAFASVFFLFLCTLYIVHSTQYTWPESSYCFVPDCLRFVVALSSSYPSSPFGLRAPPTLYLFLPLSKDPKPHHQPRESGNLYLITIPTGSAGGGGVGVRHEQ